MNSRFVSIALLTFAVTGCNSFLVSVPLCKTIPDQRVPAVPGQVTASFEKEQTIDLRDQIAEYQDKLAAVELQSIALMPASGITDFNWVEAGQLSLKEADGSHTKLVDYVRPDPLPTNKSLHLDVDPTDVLSRIASGPLSVIVDLTGELPTEDWSTDVRVCVNVQADLLGK